jgi:hypothetical protein
VSTSGFALHRDGALYGDSLLSELCSIHGFNVRRYCDQAGLDDQYRLGRVPPLPVLYRFREKQPEYSAALVALRAPDARLLLSARASVAFTPRPSDALECARRVLARLSGVGFRAHLGDRGELLISDALGAGRDPSRFLRLADLFDVLVEGLAEVPDLLTEKEKEQ